MAHVIRGQRSLPPEVLAVLRNQHEAGVGSVIDRFRPGVADPVGKIVGEPFVHIEQQSIVLRIPAGCGLKIDRDRESPYPWIERTRRLDRPRYDGAILVLGAPVATGIVSSYNLLHVRLVDVEKASEMHSANMKPADADRCVFERFELHRQACLDAIGILVVLNETYHDRGTKECAGGNRDAGSGRQPRRRSGCEVRICAGGRRIIQTKSRKIWRTGKRKKFCLGVETVFKRAAGIFPVVELRDVARAPAGWLLTGQQWSRNYAVKEPEPGSNHEIVFCTYVVGHTEPRVKILPLRVKYVGGPSLPFPPKPSIQCQPVRGTPFILNVQAIISVIESP